MQNAMCSRFSGLTSLVLRNSFKSPIQIVVNNCGQQLWSTIVVNYCGQLLWSTIVVNNYSCQQLWSTIVVNNYSVVHFNEFHNSEALVVSLSNVLALPYSILSMFDPVPFQQVCHTFPFHVSLFLFKLFNVVTTAVLYTEHVRPCTFPTARENCLCVL